MTSPDPQQPFAPEPQSAPIPYTREFVVDPGYATRLTRAIVIRFVVRGPATYVALAMILLGIILRIGNGSTASGVSFVVFGLFLLIAFPILLFFSTRRAYRRQVPAGSRIRTGFGVDRFAVDAPMSTTAVPYTNYRGAERRGELVFLRQRVNRRWVAFPGQLFGDEDLARFPRV